MHCIVPTAHILFRFFLRSHCALISIFQALEAAKREDELRTKLIDSEEQLRSLNAAQSNTSRVTTVHVQGLEAKVAELTREAEVAKSKV